MNSCIRLILFGSVALTACGERPEPGVAALVANPPAATLAGLELVADSARARLGRDYRMRFLPARERRPISLRTRSTRSAPESVARSKICSNRGPRVARPPSFCDSR